MTHERTGMAHSKQPQEIDSVIFTSIIASTMVERLRFNNIRNNLLTYRVNVFYLILLLITNNSDNSVAAVS